MKYITVDLWDWSQNSASLLVWNSILKHLSLVPTCAISTSISIRIIVWEPAWNKREISISISSQEKETFPFFVLVLISHLCLFRKWEPAWDKHKHFIRHLEYFQISSNITALAYAIFSCACFTCGNVASLWLCLCLCLSHKWEPGFIFHIRCFICWTLPVKKMKNEIYNCRSTGLVPNSASLFVWNQQHIKKVSIHI